jgi:hypothetical protein
MNQKLFSIINRGTGEVISIPAAYPEEALITAYILKEEDGEQQNFPSWYRRKMKIIELSQSLNILILGEWSITVERKKKNEQETRLVH